MLIRLIRVSFCVCAFMTSCGGIGDTITDLGDGYFYFGEGPHSNNIFYKKTNEKSPSFSTTIDQTIIYPNVSRISFDNRYIIAVQEPDYQSIIYTIMSEDGLETFNTKEERIKNEKQADSILKHRSRFRRMLSMSKNYYIIDKLRNKVYGPLDSSAFLGYKNKMKVQIEFN